MLPTMFPINVSDVYDMNDLEKKKIHASRQRKYRDKRRSQGYERLDIFIPPDLWRKLRPHIGHYKPGIGLIKFLENIDFGDG